MATWLDQPVVNNWDDGIENEKENGYKNGAAEGADVDDEKRQSRSSPYKALNRFHFTRTYTGIPTKRKRKSCCATMAAACVVILKVDSFFRTLSLTGSARLRNFKVIANVYQGAYKSKV